MLKTQAIKKALLLNQEDFISAQEAITQELA